MARRGGDAQVQGDIGGSRMLDEEDHDGDWCPGCGNEDEDCTCDEEEDDI